MDDLMVVEGEAFDPGLMAFGAVNMEDGALALV